MCIYIEILNHHHHRFSFIVTPAFLCWISRTVFRALSVKCCSLLYDVSNLVCHCQYPRKYVLCALRILPAYPTYSINIQSNLSTKSFYYDVTNPSIRTSLILLLWRHLTPLLLFICSKSIYVLSCHCNIITLCLQY